MSKKPSSDQNVVKLQKAQWFYTVIAGIAFVAPFAWGRYAPHLFPSLASATSAWNGYLVMIAWGVTICAAVIALVYGARVFVRRPLHLLTILPIVGCVGILISARQLFH
jgi:hypothetical protein